jgi:hypothetical protein
MSSSCMGKELPKEKKWGIRNCRALKCPELRKNENETHPEDSQERCQVFGTMPGNLSCCIKDPAMPPGEFLDRAVWNLHDEWEKGVYNRKTPGPKNCPKTCPYKISEIGKVFGSSKNGYKEKQGTIWKCAFTGAVLGSGLAASCPCHVLDNPDQEEQIETLVEIIKAGSAKVEKALQCGNEFCPDGALRCGIGETSCPVIKLPFAEMKVCPLWRIPAKLLPAQVAEPEKPQTSEKDTHLSSVAPTIKKETEKPPKTKKSTAEKPPKKEKPDPICEACRERYKDPIEDYQCAWCKEQQEKHGRRGWTTTLQMGEVHLGDMNVLGEQIPAESIDLIFTDPAYVKDQYQEAYANLAGLALRVLKPHGFLITYAPQTHLDEIMDMLRYNGTWLHGGKLQYFWIIESLNEGQSTAKNHQRNAICLHKPILVFQKAHEGEPLKGVRRCFADVVRGRRQKKYHPWQQSIHDVIGIISRFMDPGEILLDPYAGTGTTLKAANLLGMDWIGFEIDPKTHAIAVRELQQQPMDLQAFGIEAEAAECEREPAPEQKDTSKQAAIDPKITKPRETGKHLAAIEQSGARPVELHAACLSCKNIESCITHTPSNNCGFRSNKNPEEIPFTCQNCQFAIFCMEHDPKAGCAKKFGGITGLYVPGDQFRERREKEEKKNRHKPRPKEAGTGGSPQPYVQHCCGTCGHHKGKKTFHESCPRLGELLFKKGTKSAKVLMEETQRENCEHWTDIPGDLYVPEKIQDCFGKLCDTITGLAGCEDCADHEACHKEWAKRERKKNSCCAEVPKKRTPKIGVDLQYCETLCANCGHHLSKFDESCPRYNDLLEGGYTERELMEEVQRDGCPHKIPKCAKPAPKKKSGSGKPKPYTIYIKQSDGVHPIIVSCDAQGHGGTSNPCDTREEVIKRALVTLDGFNHNVKKSTLSKKPLPVTIETTLFIDKTGMFSITDFFEETGEPKKPEPRKSASKKSKKEES